MSQHWTTIPQMVFEQAARYGQKTVFRVRQAGSWREISWSELLFQVERIALGLLDLGVHPGDRVAILSENRPEWAYADLAALGLGAATVPIYTTLTSPEIEYILQNSGAKILFVSTPELMAKTLSFQEKLNLKVVLFDAPYRISGPRVFWLGELIGLGNTAGSLLRGTFNQRLSEGKSEDLASIIYTSGTTGPPKGVMLTHGNFLSNAKAVHKVLPITEADSTLSFLPLSHVFERMAGYYFVLLVGGSVSFAESLEKVPENLLEIRPTILTSVPRFYEKIRERVMESVEKAPVLKRRIFHWAMRVGPHNPLADRLVFSTLRQRMGGRLRFCVSGGAPLSKELAEFFYRAGILILEGYGLTETSPVITVNQPEKFQFGTVGLPIPGVEVTIASDGEILTRGPHVMKGYFRNEAATKEAIDSQGWFHTGDIGALSPDGFLSITDRKKDILKTSGGKMVAPQNLENALKKDPWMSDCVVIGDRRRYLTALIVPNLSKVEAFARSQGIPYENREALVKKPQVVQLILERVEALNRTLAPFEQLKKVTLLPEPFTLGAGELTPTLKVKRQVVAQRYAAQIEAMYREG